MLSDEELNGSLYYPACGIDSRPLARFYPTVKTFVYSDWNCTEDAVRQTFEHDFPQLHYVSSRTLTDADHQPARLKLVATNPRDQFVGQTHADDPSALPPTELYPPGFRLRAIEEESYFKQQQTACGVQHPWAREFKYRTTTPGKESDIRLVYFSDEALARYSVSYFKRDVAPRIVCTMRSGPKYDDGWACLEEPDGPLKRLLERCPRQPRIWIRGGEGGAPRGISEWSVAVEQFPDWEATAFARDGDEKAKVGIKAIDATT